MAKENLHRRKAVPLPAARVTCAADCIAIVAPDVVGKNASHTGGHGGLRHVSTATKKLRDSIRAGLEEWRIAELIRANNDERSALIERSQAMDGAWRLEVIGVWPTERGVIKGRPCDVPACPMGDADAAIPQALDALQHAGILDDDARVVEVRAWNLYRKGERWTVIRLVRVPDLAERDAQVAHLVATLPPPSAAAPVATKRRKR